MELQFLSQIGEAVLTSIHNLCFGAKITKLIGIPLHTPGLLYKSGDTGGIRFMNLFSMCNSLFLASATNQNNTFEAFWRTLLK